jgi:hypothetical protein
MGEVHHLSRKWLPISTAPSNSNLEVGVVDKNGVHALMFPVRKNGPEWVDASTKKRIEIQPTHWRLWTEDR